MAFFLSSFVACNGAVHSHLIRCAIEWHDKQKCQCDVRNFVSLVLLLVFHKYKYTCDIYCRLQASRDAESPSDMRTSEWYRILIPENRRAVLFSFLENFPHKLISARNYILRVYDLFRIYFISQTCEWMCVCNLYSEWTKERERERDGQRKSAASLNVYLVLENF